MRRPGAVFIAPGLFVKGVKGNSPQCLTKSTLCVTIWSQVNDNVQCKGGVGLPTYKVTNRVTREVARIDAPYAQDACERLGWLIGYCHVECVQEGPYTDLGRAPVVTRPQDGRKRGGVRNALS